MSSSVKRIRTESDILRTGIILRGHHVLVTVFFFKGFFCRIFLLFTYLFTFFVIFFKFFELYCKLFAWRRPGQVKPDWFGASLGTGFSASRCEHAFNRPKSVAVPLPPSPCCRGRCCAGRCSRRRASRHQTNCKTHISCTISTTINHCSGLLLTFSSYL